MKKWLTTGISICAVVLLVLCSLINVVGYQSLQSSNQQTIKEKFSQKELLFQTIVDVANNKKIQQIILKSQMNREIYPVSDIPVITNNQLKQIYLIGLILSKFHTKSKMQSIVEKYQFGYQEMQKEISAVIEKDATIDYEVTQLSNSKCDCDNEKTSIWDFPILCSILYVLIQIIDIPYLFFAGLAVWAFYHLLKGLVLIFSVIAYIGLFIEWSLFYLGVILNCWPSSL